MYISLKKLISFIVVSFLINCNVEGCKILNNIKEDFI